jgi:DNA ligase 1
VIDFPSLVLNLEKCKTPSSKQVLLQDYFETASDHDKLHALSLFIGISPKRILTLNQLKNIAIKESTLPEWIFDESLKVVGDISETIANIIDLPENERAISISIWVNVIENLSNQVELVKETEVWKYWCDQTPTQRFIFNKLITGSFKSPVSKRTLIKSISNDTGIDAETLALRLSVDWNPKTITWKELIFSEISSEEYSGHYPFIYPQLTIDLRNIDLNKYSAEWHYNGIRAQLIKRNAELFIWSKKSELITNLFPELIAISNQIPNGFVIDGIINVFQNGRIQPKSQIVNRIKKKRITNKSLNEFPAVFIATDLLEIDGKDIRSRQLEDRRNMLIDIVKEISNNRIVLSENLNISSAINLNEFLLLSRFNSASGIVFKSLSAKYSERNTAESYLRINAHRLTISAVLIYATQSIEPSAFAYSNFTFAIWNKGELLPITKAEEGLTIAELEELNVFIKNNTIERFGPVRSVLAKHVFEISFDDVLVSTRHKSGVNLVNPKISKWLMDEPIENASRLDSLKNLIVLF